MSPAASAAEFKPGQRWRSETEPELGLGLVIDADMRRVQLLFPAGGEVRQYAALQAPLKRVTFSAGDTVAMQDESKANVDAVEERDGILFYSVRGELMPESAIADTITLDDPLSDLKLGHLQASSLFDLRCEALERRCRQRASPVRGMVGARIDLIPHQLYIAGEVCARHNPRVLLADEVGLGKTIEACLIMHRLLLSGKVQRVLVLMPEPLIYQWFVELYRRFNLSFSILERDGIEQEMAKADSQNPFATESLCLCGMEFVASSSRAASLVVSAGWDLVIVDEAHHLRWTPEKASNGYLVVEELARNTEALLLLTASPEQMGREGHFARLRLLDPHRYGSLQRFIDDHADYAQVAAQAEAALAANDADQLAALIDHHGPGRVIFRNTRTALPWFPRRIAHLIPLDAGEDPQDPRMLWLVEFLRQEPGRKVLVICRTRAQVGGLDEQLRRLVAVKVAHFHEGLPIIRCDQQAAWFAEPEGAQVLIASEIGGEGRNFQFVNHLVLIDLPDDPELLEQRIGRLDRIGQKGEIHIHVPFLRGSHDEQLVRWLHEGVNAFQSPPSDAYALLEAFGDRLREQVDDALIAETQRMHRELQDAIEQGRDRLMELHSFSPQRSAALVDAVLSFDRDTSLDAFMAEVFELFGVGAENVAPRTYRLQPEQLFCEDFPLPRRNMVVTYERDYALHHPDVTFVSCDHPMVESALDLLVGSERGRCALAGSSAIEEPLLQAVYVIEPFCMTGQHATRFLVPTPIRIQINPDGAAVAGWLSSTSDCEAWELLENTALVEQVHTLVNASRTLVEQKSVALIEAARAEMRQALQREIDRLVALSRVNDHIRDDEIEAAQSELEKTDEALRTAPVRLDCMRVIVPVA